MRARTAAVFLLPFVLAAHDPITTKITWTQEISRIVLKRCGGCHREGGVAFSLLSYDDARPWAKAIRDQVLQRLMPPWGAVPGVRDLRDDPSLTTSEMDMIVNWVEGGAPEGDAAYLPRRTPPAALASVAPKTGIPIRSEFVAPNALTIAGVRPLRLTEGASMEVTAYLPSGEVRHLIWLRDYRKRWARTYLFREALRVPRGTRVRVFAEPEAGALLVTAR